MSEQDNINDPVDPENSDSKPTDQGSDNPNPEGDNDDKSSPGDTLLTGGEDSQGQDDSDDQSDNSDGYELSLEEDSLINQDQLDEFSSLAKENGLTEEQAKALLNHQTNTLKNYQETQEKEAQRQSAQWVEDIKKDTELGGSVFKESIENAHRAFQRFGSNEFKAHLDKSGLGNHPEVIRTFSRIGKAMANDKFINGEVNSAKKDVSLGEAMYKGFDY